MQFRILEIIKEFIKNNQLSPTFDEIGYLVHPDKPIGRNLVAYYIYKLVDAGLVTVRRTPRGYICTRSIKPID